MVFHPFLRWMALVFCLGFLSACATRPIVPSVRARMKRVGVISLMDDEVVFQRFGITVFGNSRKTVPIDSLGLHPLGEQIVADGLQGRGSVRLESERGRVARSVNRTAIQRWIAGRTIDEKALGEEARRLGAAYGIDSLIVLEPGSVTLPYPERTIWGYTLEQRSFFGKETTTAMAVQKLDVYDARTGHPIGNAYGLGMAKLPDAAWHSADPSEIRTSLGKLTTANVEAMLTSLGLRVAGAPAH